MTKLSKANQSTFFLKIQNRSFLSSTYVFQTDVMSSCLKDIRLPCIETFIKRQPIFVSSSFRSTCASVLRLLLTCAFIVLFSSPLPFLPSQLFAFVALLFQFSSFARFTINLFFCHHRLFFILVFWMRLIWSVQVILRICSLYVRLLSFFLCPLLLMATNFARHDLLQRDWQHFLKCQMFRWFFFCFSNFLDVLRKTNHSAMFSHLLLKKKYCRFGSRRLL